MRSRILTIVLTATSAFAFGQNVGIGNTSFTPNDDALLELRSTTSGFLLPKMTEVQKNAIVGPTEGLIVYQTNGTKGFKYYNGTVWTEFGGAADNFGDHTATANIRLDDHWLSNDGGNEGIRITDDGNVGIGVSIPSERLHVGGRLIVDEDIYDNSGNIRLSGEDDVYITMDYNNNDSDNRSIRFGKNSMTAPTELMRINEDGNVGIGTTTPDAKLNVGDSNGASIYLTREDSNTTTGEVLGSILFDSTDDTTPSTNDASAGIRAYASNDHGNSNKGGHLAFFTKDNINQNASASERMRIQSDGKVGVGTSTPKTALHIKSTGGESGFTPGFGAAGPEIAFSRGGFYNPAATIQMIDFNGYSSGLCFNVHKGVNYGGGGAFADNWPTDVVQALTIINTGNVGIGATNPSAKLHVSGDARITDLAGSGTRMVVADANGDLSTQALPSSGSSPTTVDASSSVNINSASYTSVSGMSISSVAAGTYLVNFNADIERNGSSSCQCIVRAGGSDDSDTERTFQIPSSGASQFHLMGKVTLSSTGTIEVRCKKIPGGSGITVGARAMSIQATN